MCIFQNFVFAQRMNDGRMERNTKLLISYKWQQWPNPQSIQSYRKFKCKNVKCRIFLGASQNWLVRSTCTYLAILLKEFISAAEIYFVFECAV